MGSYEEVRLCDNVFKSILTKPVQQYMKHSLAHLCDKEN